MEGRFRERRAGRGRILVAKAYARFHLVVFFQPAQPPFSSWSCTSKIIGLAGNQMAYLEESKKYFLVKYFYFRLLAV